MPNCSRKEPPCLPCAKEKPSPEKTSEAELWLNMMSSMLNFAMASTAFMKSIQKRVEISKKIPEERRAIKAEEYFRQELVKPLAEFNRGSDFSLRTKPILREDTCKKDTCTVLFRKNEVKENGAKYDAKESSGPEKLFLCSDFHTSSGLVEDEKKKFGGEEAKVDYDGSCICEPKDCENFEEENIGYEDEIVKKVAHVSEPEVKVRSSGCQSTSFEDVMAKELRLANLEYQLRQTDKNLKELKREMCLISNSVGGQKKCPFNTAEALYEEIMRPRSAVDDTVPVAPRK